MNAPAALEPPATQAPGPPATTPPRTPQRRRPSDGRTLAVGLAISALVHVAIVLVSRHVRTTGVPPRVPASAETDAPAAPPGLRVYRIVPGPDAAPPVEVQVAREPDRPSPAEPVEPAPAEPSRPAAGDATAAVPSVAERLRPGVEDRRIWIMPRDLPPPMKSDAELMRERLYGRIEVLNDSVLAELEAERRAMDWTITGADGKRWGISPEGIHLGGITLPAPSFGPPAGRRDEINGRLREWAEIQDQADRARIRDRFDERARETRKRKDEERAQKKPPPKS